MKKLYRIFWILMLVNIYTLAQGTGMGNFGGRHHLNPDSLETITVEGVVIVEDTSIFTKYYLDDDEDGIADYYLSFGPYWYTPDSSAAIRPSAGDEVIITGGLHTNIFSENIIAVYEINGEFWRNPHYARWNNLGRHSFSRRHGSGQIGCGYGFNWEHDSLTTVDLTGNALLDTTFLMTHYYLDTDSDSEPDYFLNFGPFWYEPESGALRPRQGDQITVKAGLLENGELLPMAIVFELNGQVWRDTTGFGSHFGGGWINSNQSGSMEFFSPFDPFDRITINSGWHQGMGGGMMNNSLFCQILEAFPQNMPYLDNENVLAAYEINMFNEDGTSGMRGHGGMGGGRMNFNSQTNYQLHYTETQLDLYNVDEEKLEVKYWDEDADSWTTIAADFDKENNLVNFSETTVPNLVIITEAQTVTSVENEDDLVEKFSLAQNYPNPFNPATTIEFSLASDSNVKLMVYNIIGQKVASLVNEKLSGGVHKVSFNASDLPSGIYIYQLTAGNIFLTKKMSLIK